MKLKKIQQYTIKMEKENYKNLMGAVLEPLINKDMAAIVALLDKYEEDKIVLNRIRAGADQGLAAQNKASTLKKIRAASTPS